MDNANAASAVSSKPKKNNSLLQRVISVLVLLPLIIAIVWWNYWAVAVVLAGVVAISLLELYGTLTHGGYQPQRWIGLASALALVATVAVQPGGTFPNLLGLVLTAIVIGSLLAELPRSRGERTLASWGLTVAGALYVGWLFSFIVALRAIDVPLRDYPLAQIGLPSGAAWVFAVMAITWLQDTFAYFVGKRFGRTKMAPDLSPKKTWEGAIGGFCGALVGAILSIYVFCLPITIPQALLLGAVGGVVGPLGDLAESLMKRQLGIKDAGTLIPGHGGVLDRADSLLFCAPVLYYLIVLMVGA